VCCKTLVVINTEQDLVTGLTPCSAVQSNNHGCKPIVYAIARKDN